MGGALVRQTQLAVLSMEYSDVPIMEGKPCSMSERIAVLGLGYVGLPVALAFARKFPGTVGFDINSERVRGLRRGHDWSGEVCGDQLAGSSLHFTSDPADLSGTTLYVVAVPTP